MPNCPVCGRGVPTGILTCPTCGTNLQATYGVQTAQNPVYSSTPSPPSSEMSVPSSSASRGRGRYVTIIVALLIGLVIGGVVGYTQPVAAQYTTVTGSVTLSSQMTTQGGRPTLVWFNSTIYGNLTAAVISNSYLINVPTGDTYSVSVQWFNGTGTYRCNPSQNIFSSNNRSATQDLSC